MGGFDPGDPKHAGPELSADAILPPAERPRFTFLAPPRGPGELGRLGNYRVVRLLGAGGMGLVFEAEDTVLHRPVALKVLRPELAADPHSRERFLREARAAAALPSDHIVTVYHVYDSPPPGQGGRRASDALPYLAMEFLHGESLQSRIERQPRLEVTMAVTVARQVAAGLAAAHARGVVHRDIKPANIWLESDGPGGPFRRVKLLDFGLARRDRGEASLTATGLIVGTPNYMAPEQASGFATDHRADLFSLGCVLYTTLAGELPFKGDSAMAVMMALATQTPPPLGEMNPAVPVAVSDLVARLLAKEPAERPQTAGEVIGVLDAVLVGLPPRVPTPAAGVPPARANPSGETVGLGSVRTVARSTTTVRPAVPDEAFPGWWPVLRVVGVVLVLALIVGAWQLLRPVPAEQPPPPAKLGALTGPDGTPARRVYWSGPAAGPGRANTA